MRIALMLVILISVQSCTTREPLDPRVIYGNADSGKMAIDVEWRTNATDEDLSNIGQLLFWETMSTCLNWGYNDFDSVDYRRYESNCIINNFWTDRCEIVGVTYYRQCTNS